MYMHVAKPFIRHSVSLYTLKTKTGVEEQLAADKKSGIRFQARITDEYSVLDVIHAVVIFLEDLFGAL